MVPVVVATSDGHSSGCAYYTSLSIRVHYHWAGHFYLGACLFLGWNAHVCQQDTCTSLMCATWWWQHVADCANVCKYVLYVSFEVQYEFNPRIAASPRSAAMEMSERTGVCVYMQACAWRWACLWMYWAVSASVLWSEKAAPLFCVSPVVLCSV